eukprot:TRINITY_DN2696_c0_g3_i1.p1 TRINITY_DN2696_c0_g3~~TRINITY_DN2696_c0_g3_i1.p1  ORF type:complete len:429 (+),score=67.04 TRINITY_DN2696_c0_g3_i1:51-1289(+)
MPAPSSLPETWLERQGAGGIIGNFIPCKVPLDERWSDAVSGEQSFGWAHVKAAVEEAGKELIGVISLIPLPSVYYNKYALLKEGLQYCQLLQEHMLGLPKINFILSFVRVADEMLRNNQNGIIAVHCTDGYNLTGFSICSYLIHKGYKPEDALQLFAESRSPGIYHSCLIDYLHYSVYAEDLAATKIKYPRFSKEFLDPTRGTAIVNGNGLGFTKKNLQAAVTEFKTALTWYNGPRHGVIEYCPEVCQRVATKKQAMAEVGIHDPGFSSYLGEHGEQAPEEHSATGNDDYDEECEEYPEEEEEEAEEGEIDPLQQQQNPTDLRICFVNPFKHEQGVKKQWGKKGGKGVKGIKGIKGFKGTGKKGAKAAKKAAKLAAKIAAREAMARVAAAKAAKVAKKAAQKRKAAEMLTFV